MVIFWKAIAGTLVAVVLGLVLGKQEKDISVMLSMAVCAMVVVVMLQFLDPVLELLRRLESLGNLGGGILGVLLKAMGIGLVAEIAGMICTDAGNAALSRTVQLLGAGTILWLSIPVFDSFLALIQQILGGV